jgi:transcriptional regulator with XRE-family HTH domain
MLMEKTLGQRIRELREELDLSLRELAKKVEGQAVSATHLSDIEQSHRFPSDELLAKIAKALNTTVDHLKSFDSRPPLEEIKRISESDPNYGFALRKMVDKKISGEELLKFIDKQRKNRS